MKGYLIVAASLLMSVMVAVPASAQSGFKVEKGEALNKIVPKDFVLEANAIPTEKRDSALVITPSGSRLVVGLLDTSGYSSNVQMKYSGMLITEGKLGVCGHHLAVGSYGFGIVRAEGFPESHKAQFVLYNQGGHKVMGCSAAWDSEIKTPRPLQVVVKGNTARLYLGRNWVELK